VLRRWGLDGLADSAELVVSELVTNAVRAACGTPEPWPVRLWLTAEPARVAIGVWDCSPVPPRLAHAGDADESGRGLFLVQGNVLGHSASGANTFVAGIVDIEALRQFRTMNLNSNWMKDLRTEIFRGMYDAPVHPKNLWLTDEPLPHADVDEIYRANIARLIARGSFTPPARAFPGARYMPPGESPGEDGWEQLRDLWSRPGTD